MIEHLVNYSHTQVQQLMNEFNILICDINKSPDDVTQSHSFLRSRSSRNRGSF